MRLGGYQLSLRALLLLATLLLAVIVAVVFLLTGGAQHRRARGTAIVPSGPAHLLVRATVETCSQTRVKAKIRSRCRVRPDARAAVVVSGTSGSSYHRRLSTNHEGQLHLTLPRGTYLIRLVADPRSERLLALAPAQTAAVNLFLRPRPRP